MFSLDITISKREDSNILIRISQNNTRCELHPEQSINIDDIIFGYWDGKIFQMISRDLEDYVLDHVKITSNGIIISLINFKSINFIVNSPLLEIRGVTKIDNFEVNINDYSEPEAKKFIINGTLLTKSLILNCSAEINGALYLKENGFITFDSLGVYKLVLNGELNSAGELKIHKDECSSVDIINNGIIFSETGIISCLVNDFVNEKNGKIEAEEGNFEIDGGRFVNLGELKFNNFSIRGGRRMMDFLQNGVCIVVNQANFDCGMVSTGETFIRHLVFQSTSGFNTKNVKVIQGETEIHKITGNVSIIQSENGAKAIIGEIDGDTDFAISSGDNSTLVLNEIKSNSKLSLSANSGGSTILKKGDLPESFIYSDNGKLDISNIEGKSTVYVNGIAKVKVNNAEDLSLLANEEARTHISQSSVKDAYLKNKSNIIFESKVDTIFNHSKLDVADIQINRITNDAKVEFWNKSSTKKFVDNGKSIFRDGDHKIETVHLSNSKLKVEGMEEEEREGRLLLRENDESDDPSVSAILRDGGANVNIKNIIGYGSIDCKNQTYKQLIPTSFETNGNTDVHINRMPRPEEIPIHSGSFAVEVDMDKNYINREDIDYGDAIFVMKMKDKYKWVNEGDFKAGGVIVDKATEFLNKNGHIELEKILDVKAREFRSEADPIARDNSRRVDISFFGHHLSYVCPATYYSKNKKTGINVYDGDINIKSENDIVNRFTSIYASGNFTACAKGKFENIVGTINAQGEGKSFIKAKKVTNACLPAFCRKGEGYASGSSGGLFNRSSWSIHGYTREWVTQSHGSKMTFGGDLEIDGPTENPGSTIKCYGLLKGNINSKSVFENIATVESGGMAIEGDEINTENVRIIVHDNNNVNNLIQ